MEKLIIIKAQVPVYISDVFDGVCFDLANSESSEASMPLVERLPQLM